MCVYASDDSQSSTFHLCLTEKGRLHSKYDTVDSTEAMCMYCTCMRNFVCMYIE